jgi:hypothetical protein
MERIGIAASKMAKEKLWLYNFYVLFLSFLISLIVFLVAGGAIFLGIILIGLMARGVLPSHVNPEWLVMLRLSLVCLTIVISLIALAAVVKNIKFRKG